MRGIRKRARQHDVSIQACCNQPHGQKGDGWITPYPRKRKERQMTTMDVAAIPVLSFDVGLCGCSQLDSVLEPVTTAVMIIIAVL